MEASIHAHGGRLFLAGALGEDAHVAGVARALQVASEVGWSTIGLGPCVSVQGFLRAIHTHRPDLVGISYRLTPETGESLLVELIAAVRAAGPRGCRFLFAGTPPLAERARALHFFERCFEGGESPEELANFFRGKLSAGEKAEDYPQDFRSRLAWKAPFPLIRHHFGRPTIEETERGIEAIASAMALDVVSLGIDQDAQENFYHPERQDSRRAGAGGVPVRSPEDYRRLYAASRRGNFPLLRAYSGTDDHLRLAEMYLDTFRNAWCATSLFWFGQLDRRGPLDVESSIRAHQQLMRWHAEREVPVELNEPHHWGMREASDVISVVSSFLSAYNARAMGVRDYIAQYMFNCPGGMSDRMDLAKMLACVEIGESLAGPNFRMHRQTRTGLLSHPVDPDRARGHLGASVYLQMALRPQIVHVVGFSEAHHATTAEELIQSCRMAHRAIANALGGMPDPTADPVVQRRKEHLIREAKVTLEAIRRLASAGESEPWTDPAVLARAVACGILDAPHLRGHPAARGGMITRILDGASEAVDPQSGRILSEDERLRGLEAA